MKKIKPIKAWMVVEDDGSFCAYSSRSEAYSMAAPVTFMGWTEEKAKKVVPVLITAK